MSDAVKPRVSTVPYMKKGKGFFDRLEKANDKVINVKVKY